MSTKALWRSFAGGEITPELFGRIELTKFQTGLRLCKNFITLPHGPAVRRPGTRLVLEAKDPTRPVRSIPFSASVEDTFVIEVGHQYMRFHTNGETVVEAPKTISSIVGSTVTATAHGYTTGDWVFIGPRPHVVTVTGADTFTTADTAGSPTVAVGTTASRIYTLTTTYAGADVFDIHYAQDNEVLTLTHPGYPARELKRVSATNWTLTDVSFAPTLAAPTGVGVVPTIAVSSNLSPQRYVVTAVAGDGVTESLQSSVVNTSNNLTLAGNFNTISWSAVSGAARYNVYKQRGGSFGYIGQTTGLSIVDDNVLADTTKVPPEAIITLNTGPNDYPAAVTYHEQRRWFAGTNARPQNIFATRSGTSSNLTSSVPSQADDALNFRVAAQQQNRVRHLVPLSDLMALTANADWRIFSDNEPAITPTSLTVKPMGYAGSSNVQPVVTAGSVLYIQSQGARVRELAYGGEGGGSYRTIDMSIMSPHLFNGFVARDMCYQRTPDQIAWVVRNDGTLLGMTYVPEQQVYGWHQHSTAGSFESVCSVDEDNADALYAVVSRTIGSRTTKFIERMAPRIFTMLADAYFVDCGGTYSGTPATTISGLWHLEGETVSILADGAVEPDQTVVNGSITLDNPASLVHVGLAYESDLQTLPLAFEGMQAAGQGMLKNVLSADLRVTQTSLFKVGPSFDKLIPNRSRAVSDPFDSAPSLKTAEIRVNVPGNWGTDGSVCVRQDAPLPLSVLAMTLAVGGGG